MKMVWIPRRHRTLVYKLLVLIPVAWLTIAFLLYNGNNTHLAANTEPRHELSENSNEELVISPAALAQKQQTPEIVER